MTKATIYKLLLLSFNASLVPEDITRTLYDLLNMKKSYPVTNLNAGDMVS